MGRAIEALRGKRSASQLGGKPPIPALTYVFSIGSNRGHKTDDFEPRIIESPNAQVDELPRRRREGACKATKSRRK
jgi:hypothetical protein